MTLLTIEEAAKFLRLKKRTLYQRRDIPRVRYGHKVMFIKEELAEWVTGHRESPVTRTSDQKTRDPVVDPELPTVYHRNPLFVATGRKEDR